MNGALALSIWGPLRPPLPHITRVQLLSALKSTEPGSGTTRFRRPSAVVETKPFDLQPSLPAGARIPTPTSANAQRRAAFTKSSGLMQTVAKERKTREPAAFFEPAKHTLTPNHTPFYPTPHHPHPPNFLHATAQPPHYPRPPFHLKPLEGSGPFLFPFLLFSLLLPGLFFCFLCLCFFFFFPFLFLCFFFFFLFLFFFCFFFCFFFFFFFFVLFFLLSLFCGWLALNIVEKVPIRAFWEDFGMARWPWRGELNVDRREPAHQFPKIGGFQKRA